MPATEIQTLVDGARGWTVVTFTGPDDFVRAAMRQAMDRGLKVAPVDDLQIGLLVIFNLVVNGDPFPLQVYIFPSQ